MQLMVQVSAPSLLVLTPPPPTFGVVFQRVAAGHPALCLPVWCLPPPGRGVELLPAR